MKQETSLSSGFRATLSSLLPLFLTEWQQVVDQVLHFLRSGSFFGDNAQQFACPAQLKPKLS